MKSNLYRMRQLSARTQARATAAVLRRQARGVTMLEYVIMGAIVLVLGILLRTQLLAIFNSMLTQMKSFVGK